MKKIFVFVIIGISVIFSCTTSRLLTENLSYLYDKDMQPFIPQCVAYNTNDSITTVYFSIYSGSLLYVNEFSQEYFTAKFSVRAEVYDSYEMKQMIDSSGVSMKDNDNTRKRNISGKIDLKIKLPGIYLLKVIFSDNNKHTSVETFLNIYRNSPAGVENFMLLRSDSLPYYHSWISADDEFVLVSNNKKLDKLFVRYYDRVFPVATPPYSEASLESFDFTADSIFTVPLENGKTGLLKLAKKGIYHFQSDTSNKEGYTVFRFGEDFPKVTTLDQMMQPLRYLTARYEFDDMMIMKNKKEAIDKFWIETAGNADRAKELIKLFYNRVQDANRYFTSYIEGWKSDRGIIYIVYGPPNIIYRGKNLENWVYGEDRNMLSITFSFYKVENPFTDNDYSLSRSPVYKDGWYIAVENWRR
jgi:GWxTD domain-containing protein